MDFKEEVLSSLALLKKELESKVEPQNMGAPELVLIEHDDYHAKYLGRTASGLQFFFPPIFVPGGHEYTVLFLFNEAGELVESKMEDHGLRETFNVEYARGLRSEWLREIGPVEFQDIQVKPFAVELGGEIMGMIPLKFDDYWVVEVLPGNVMAFVQPWDSGLYDT